MSFTVAIVGRPNVGKSTLFNRLVGKKLALVDDTPGVTRDRRPGEAKLVDLRFTIIDTAGLEQSGPETLQGRMWAQTEAAIDEADVTLFVVDAKAGLTPADETLAEMLRRRGKPVVLVANKSEARGSDAGFYDAFTLGLGDPCPISAEHGQGMIDLRDAIVGAIGEDAAFPPEVDEAETDIVLPRGEPGSEDEEDEEPVYDETKPLRVAIIGRPNAGKSTLINRFLGEDRLLTGPEAGITRDSISVEWDWRGRTIKMFDTAGMRRKAKVTEKLESSRLRIRCVPSALRKPSSSCSTAPSRSKSRICSWLTSSSAKAAPLCLPSTSGIWSKTRRPIWPICAKRPSGFCRRRAASAPCRFPARRAMASTG